MTTNCSPSEIMRRLIAVVVIATALTVAGCTSARETVVVTERPQPAYPSADAPLQPVVPGISEGLDTVSVGEFPGGRMWTFDAVPLAYLGRTYGFDPDSSWLDHIRLATLRLPNCSAAFVSDSGLVLTNHHCIREYLPDLARTGEDLVANGFVADSSADERRPEELFADQLLAISDVTPRVSARVAQIVDDDRRSEVLGRTIETLEELLTAEAKQRDTTHHVQVVELFAGARYAAYRYRRIHDLRLVLAPEQDVAEFGGDTQNFTYPRYSLDFALLRAYSPDGTAMAPQNHFQWTDGGVSEGSAVFSAGSPGSTRRLRTPSQLEFDRDIELPIELAVLDARAAAFERFRTEQPALADSFNIHNTLLDVRNVQKEVRGRLAALRDPSFMRRVQALHAQLADSLVENDTLRRAHAEAIRAIEAVQRTRRAGASQSGAFAMFGSETIDSHILVRAIYAYLYDFARQRGAPTEYLEEYRSSGKAVEVWPRELESSLLAARLRELQQSLGASDPSVRSILDGRTPEDAASRIVAGTALVDSVGFDSLLEAGYLASSDPTVALAEGIVPLYLSIAQQQASLESREQRSMARLADIRRTLDEALPPDATFSLRLTDGVVSGYPYNGTVAPPFTTFYGMYNAHFSHEPGPDWNLPERWQTPPDDLDLVTPLNFAATIDLTGGSSGSPVFTPDLRLVGVAFDSNIQALSNMYLFSSDSGRGVAVDSRAITEVLQDVYGATAILNELRGIEATSR